ncbi:MAG TPA: shikimate dehydrogenase, partial [Candidatus Marinimicrobia bacterium]|nr:shikimate dehydrogenase [Candidatus Neomarinimicrobiota bacterium]HQQ86190.1 shikimate dehydrogenase [Candidatus Neomarinimicrobiota bacterium]
MSEKRFAIIGHPILHSKSPQIHNHWFRENNLSANYSRIIANDVYVALGMGYKLGLTGANVTAPFKEKVIPSLVYLSPEAAAVGAVNTLIYNGPNISGYNTDVTGVIRAFQINNVELKHKSLLVIGAGGAARAIVSALKPSGAEITIVNRPDEMALNLARSFQVKSVPFSEIQTA